MMTELTDPFVYSRGLSDEDKEDDSAVELGDEELGKEDEDEEDEAESM